MGKMSLLYTPGHSSSKVQLNCNKINAVEHYLVTGRVITRSREHHLRVSTRLQEPHHTLPQVPIHKREAPTHLLVQLLIPRVSMAQAILLVSTVKQSSY